MSVSFLVPPILHYFLLSSCIFCHATCFPDSFSTTLPSPCFPWAGRASSTQAACNFFFIILCLIKSTPNFWVKLRITLGDLENKDAADSQTVRRRWRENEDNLFPEICQPSPARNVTLTTLIKVHWLVLSLVWEETRGKQTQAALAQEDRGSLQAKHFWGAETKMEQGRDYFIHFWCIYFNQMMKSPSRDRRLICDDDSELIRAAAKLAKAEHHQKLGWTHDILIGYWLQK